SECRPESPDLSSPGRQTQATFWETPLRRADSSSALLPARTPKVRRGQQTSPSDTSLDRQPKLRRASTRDFHPARSAAFGSTSRPLRSAGKSSDIIWRPHDRCSTATGESSNQKCVPLAASDTHSLALRFLCEPAILPWLGSFL